MAKVDTTQNQEGLSGRKYPVAALVLVALFIIALIVVILFWGQFLAWPSPGESEGVGP